MTAWRSEPRRPATTAANDDEPGGSPEPAYPLGLPVDLEIPVPPSLFTSDGRAHLVYELHVTNFGRKALTLTRIDVLDGGTSIVDFEGAELNSMLIPVGVPPEGTPPGDGRRDNRRLGHRWTAAHVRFAHDAILHATRRTHRWASGPSTRCAVMAEWHRNVCSMAAWGGMVARDGSGMTASRHVK